MTSVIAALISGLLFGVGLAISGMTDPSVVLGFLDVAGAWNPRLAFVMGAAVPTALLGYRWALRRTAPILGGQFAAPPARDINPALLGGAALFGIGWGLAGYCPGPAIASLGGGRVELFAFVAAMVTGMVMMRIWLGSLPRSSHWRAPSAT